jgi:hypothetical protein
MSVSYGGSSITFEDGSIVSSGSQGFKNKIINGAMMISQAAAGGSITPAATGATPINFAVDRTRIAYSQNSKLTAQQNKGSVSPPAGFKNYLGVSCAATATVGSTDYFLVGQGIEGFNVSDLSWGTAAASTVTLSFWAYSNTIGTFGGSINNSAYDRSFCFSYTINVANTWEYKTVTIAGDTTGTWVTDNGVGAYVWFSLGTGSTRSKAAGSWGAGEFYGVTGANNLMGSTSNNFYITGLQLEKGTTASTFEFRSYGKELMLCQRYFEKTYEQTVAIGTATENGWEWIGSDCPNLTTSGTLQSQRPRFSVTKRTQPIMTVWDATGASAKATRYAVGGGPSNGHACTTDLITVNAFRVFVAGTTTTTNGAFHWAANAEM